MKYFTRHQWRPIDKFWAIAAVLGVFWFSLPTALFIRPVSLSVEYVNVAPPESTPVVVPQFYLLRNLPFGDVWAKVSVDLYGPYDDCQNTIDRIEFQVEGPSNLSPVAFRFSKAISECIQVGETFTVSFSRSLIVAGTPLRLRYSHDKWACPAEDGDCKPVN